MSETLISPGVLARENDNTQITARPVEVGAAIVGPTVKGPLNIPTIVNSYSDYLAQFGSKFESGSDSYSFLTSLSAFHYFQNGGNTLLVTRVMEGSWSPATSSAITDFRDQTTGSFVLETLSSGRIMNTGTTELSNGALVTGSVDNVRWEIVNPNTSSGVFSVIIRRGDDNTKSKSILESFNNVSLDPKAGNYISKVIGDITLTVQGTGTDVYIQPSGSYRNASKYVRVRAVNSKTPDYLDGNSNPKSIYTGSLPIAQSGSFGSGTGNIAPPGANFYNTINNTNTQGLTGDNYTTALNLLANKEEYKFKMISAPGLIYANADHATPLNTLVSTVESRGDAIEILDLENYGSTITAAVGRAAGIDSSYTSTYWPWVQINDSEAGKLVWVPASVMIPGVYASNDNSAEPWFAPAGINRGGLTAVLQAERKLTATNKNTLYTGKVNPVATINGNVVIMGQKTLQSKPTALDRINVRRLLIELKTYISQVANVLVFDQNTIATRNSFLSQVNPYLESVQQRQGLYAFQVTMDESNNTGDVIDRNELRGAIYIQPSRTAEFVYLDFNILPTGAEFPS